MQTNLVLSYDPSECKDALKGAKGPIILDLETTGLKRTDRIVSAGLMIDDQPFMLVAHTHVLSTSRVQIGDKAMVAALEPLAQDGPPLVIHNATYDLSYLSRAGVRVRRPVIDTILALRLIDPDRRDQGRLSRVHDEPLNYRLKDLARHLLDIDAMHFPGRAADLSLRLLGDYMLSDLTTTAALYQVVWGSMRPQDSYYYERFVAPVTPILVEMSVKGVLTDPDFITNEGDRLDRLRLEISNEHHRRFGQKLDAGAHYVRDWVFKKLKCPALKWNRDKKGFWHPSLQGPVIEQLRSTSTNPMVRESLGLLLDYSIARSLLVRTKSLLKHLDQNDIIHSSFSDRQASGRVSSTIPNLQQLANAIGPATKGKKFLDTKFAEETIVQRNALVARPGHKFVAMDVAQADIRVLANMIATWPVGHEEYLRQLHRQRSLSLSKRTRRLQRKGREYINANYQSKNVPPAERFRPGMRMLADAFVGKGDFYTNAASRVFGQRVEKGSQEREQIKRIILGVVNGKGAKSLAKDLGVDADRAGELLDSFARAFPDVASFTTMIYDAIAITGSTETIAGRRRRVTAHWWMTNLNRVDLFISYRGADKLWLRVVPLRPNKYTLTCWVERVIDAKWGSPNEGREIYNHKDGRLSTLPYRFFADGGLLYKLPVRNVSWRLIRQVRTPTEEAKYEGLDRVRRQLFNHICQGGTADIVRSMMIRAQPVCEKLGASLLLQIHDELVFEVPNERVTEFVATVQPILESSPWPGFVVPIIVEPKVGERFGELKTAQ